MELEQEQATAFNVATCCVAVHVTLQLLILESQAFLRTLLFMFYSHYPVNSYFICHISFVVFSFYLLRISLLNTVDPNAAVNISPLECTSFLHSILLYHKQDKSEEKNVTK